MRSTYKPAELELSLRTFAAKRDTDLAALTLRTAIPLLSAFYDACTFKGRKHQTFADTLVAQMGNPPGPHWLLSVGRHLYSRGRGHQVNVSIAVDREVHPFPDYMTARSADGETGVEFGDRALAAFAAWLDVAGVVTVESAQT